MEKEFLKRVKSKKKKNSNDLKKQASVYADAELLDFAYENHLNVSWITNNALKQLKSGLGEDFNTNKAYLILISKNEPKNSGSEEIRTPDLRRVKATSYH